MTGNRLDLHSLLKRVTGLDNVYYQPPANIRMQYPALVYERTGSVRDTADNIPYNWLFKYELTYISKNPDDPVPELLVNTLPYIEYSRRYVSDNLYHDRFVMYY